MSEQTITPDDVKKLLKEFISRERQTYIGMRYVPVVAEPAEWSATTTYEPLTLVTDGAFNTYISKFYVPEGVPLSDGNYWFLIGPFSQQVSALDALVRQLNAELADEVRDRTAADDAIRNDVARLENQDKKRVLAYETVADMQADTTIYDGAIARTNGFHASGDGGAGWYAITDSGTPNGKNVLACASSLVANLVVIEDFVTPEQFGAYGDFETDDTACIKAAIDYVVANPNVSLCCNNKYIVTRLNASPDGFFHMYGNGTFKRKDLIITADGNRMLSIYASGTATVVVEGLTFDGNRQNQALGDSYGYTYEHCHSLATFPRSSGASVIYRDIKTLNRVGDGVNVSSEQRYTFKDVLFDHIVGRDNGIMRGDCVVTAECENLTFIDCNVGHLETELNVATTEPYVIKCDNCTIDEWLELGSWDSPSQEIYVSNTTLKDGEMGVLQLYGNIHATNCNFTIATATPEILMYGGIISHCTFTAKDTVNYIRCFRSDSDAIQPSIHFDSCVFVKGATGVLIGANVSNTALKCKIENCIYTGGERFVNFRAGTLELVNNTVYNATLLNTTATPNSGSTYHVFNNTIFSDAPMINMSLASASDPWEIDFKCTGNKIYKYADYFSTAYTARIRSTMLFNDLVYTDADPTTPIRGSIYVEPNGIIKIAQGFNAASLKTFTLS